MNNQARIEAIRSQMKLHELQAMYWHADATTGCAKMRSKAQGCQKTAENPDGWRPLSDQEKIKSSLDNMNNHMKLMWDLHSELVELLHED